MIAQDKLKKHVSYNPLTGDFTWVIPTSFRVKVGDIAGCKDTLGYISVSVYGVRSRAHRLAWLYMTGEWPKNDIDHINHIRDDNRWVNLREATRQENHKNRSMTDKNKSGFVGVYWSKENKKWVANIKIDRKTLYLGSFNDKQKAIARRQMANVLYGFHENHGEIQ